MAPGGINASLFAAAVTKTTRWLSVFLRDTVTNSRNKSGSLFIHMETVDKRCHAASLSGSPVILHFPGESRARTELHSESKVYREPM